MSSVSFKELDAEWLRLLELRAPVPAGVNKVLIKRFNWMFPYPVMFIEKHTAEFGYVLGSTI